jgi:hypothetical protein
LAGAEAGLGDGAAGDAAVGGVGDCAELREADALVRELRGMRVKVSAGGDERFGAWRSGDHDDLVLATALACWRAKIRVPGVWDGRRLGAFF